MGGMKRVGVAVLLLALLVVAACGGGESGSSREIAPGAALSGRYVLVPNGGVPAVALASALAGALSAGTRLEGDALPYERVSLLADDVLGAPSSPKAVSLHLKKAFVTQNGAHWFTLVLTVETEAGVRTVDGMWSGLPSRPGRRDDSRVLMLRVFLGGKAEEQLLAAPISGRKILLIPLSGALLSYPVVLTR